MSNLSEKEIKAIERIDYIQDFIIENGQYNADVEDIEFFSTILNLISKLQKEKEIKLLREAVKKLQKENNKLNLENQALYESIHCDDDNMLARRYNNLKNKYNKLVDKIQAKINEYEGLKEMDKQAYQEQIKPLQEVLEETNE